MVEKDQVRPLAPASDRPTSDDEETANHAKGRRRKICTTCCGCATALLLISATIIIILIFTVFKIKDPVIKMNGVSIDQLSLINGGTTTPNINSNITLTADVSVKNPNFASFKYKNTSTSLFYHGTVIGEARGPPGKAKARRTMRLNITVDVMTSGLLGNPNLPSDLSSGLLTVTSYTRVGGRVKMLNLIKRHITVRMNCTIIVNITSTSIQEQKCRRKVNL